MKKTLTLLVSIVSLISFILVSCTSAASPTPSSSASASPTPPPVSAVSEDLDFQMGDTSLQATVTFPNSPGKHPALVLVPGSGPTDRNWNSPLLGGTNGSARLLANEFAAGGLVTIRYDKRFTGPRAQQNLPFLTGKISLESHVDEIAEVVRYLLSRSDVDAGHIYALANSEGTLHAMNYQLEREPRLAGLVLIAPPGRNLAALTRSQLEAQVALLPNAQDILAGYDRLMAAFLADKPFVADPSLPEGINSLIQNLYLPANLPFTRQIFTVDPASLLGKINSPVLVLIGKKDIQVDWQADGAPLEAAAKTHLNVSFAYPENANHVLKNEPRPRSALTSADALTYNASDRVLDSQSVKAIQDWLTIQNKN